LTLFQPRAIAFNTNIHTRHGLDEDGYKRLSALAIGLDDLRGRCEVAPELERQSEKGREMLEGMRPSGCVCLTDKQMMDAVLCGYPEEPHSAVLVLLDEIRKRR
jgi:hypothetical protein